MELLRFMDAATGKSSSPVYTIDLFLISRWGSATPYIPIFLILTPSFGVEPREVRNKPVKSASVDAASLQPLINWPGITSRSAYNWRHLTESGRREFVGEKALSAFRRCVADDKNIKNQFNEFNQKNVYFKKFPLFLLTNTLNRIRYSF